jgi:tetratricopeptide (TPR) repeat protein
MLPRDIPDFTGRDAEVGYLLDTLRTRGFAGNNVVAIHAVDGMAGIGKTTLAIHVGHRLGAEYPDALFLNLRAHTEGQAAMDPGEALEILMTMLGLPGEQIPTQVDERVARWRAELAGRRALIVLDNAASPEQVQPLLPGQSGCLVLITSRVRLIGLDGVSPLTLDTMKPADAIQLFMLIAGVDRATAEPGPVAAVALRCGYLPLAIRLVASWLRHHPAKSVEYILDRLTRTLSPISTALQLSYRDLNHDQQLMFRRLGLHPGQTFTPETAAVLADVELDRAQELLDELYDRNLIEEPQSNRYRFHDLTRDYAHNLVNNRDPEFDRRTAAARLFDYYIDTVLQQQRMQEYSWFDDELPELLSCAHYAVAHGEAGYAWRLPQALAVVLQLRGLYRQARILHVGALEAACEHRDKRAQAAIHIDLSIVDREANDRRSALSHCVESLRLYEECGDEHGQANANAEFGVVYGEIGDYRNAQERLAEALNLYVKLGNEIGQGNVHLALGVLYREMGDYHQADAHLKRALDLYGGSRHGQADTYLDLGILAKLTGSYSKARDDLVTALRFYTELGSQQGEATVHTELGDLCDLVGDRTGALRHWQQASALYADMGSGNLESVQERLRKS